VELAELFCLTTGSHNRSPVPHLLTPFGFALRLLASSKATLVRWQVCRSDDEVLTGGEQWKAQMMKEGWR
jgi:hypothetical protein